MSLRPVWSEACKPTSVVGSIFGEAIGAPVGGLFAPYAVSPPRTPPTACTRHAALPPEFHLDRDPPVAPTGTQADSVLPSWLHRFDGVALATFAQTIPGVATLRASPCLQCANVVSPIMIHADGVHWQRMAVETAGGAVGHLFSLTHEGEVVCRIEVEMRDADAVGRIAVVQPSYSALTVAANLAPASSLLVFDDVRAHIDSLKRLKPELETSALDGAQRRGVRRAPALEADQIAAERAFRRDGGLLRRVRRERAATRGAPRRRGARVARGCVEWRVCQVETKEHGSTP